MTHFRVLVYKEGILDDGPPQDVQAATELAAAETACGGPLVETGGPRQLRAMVWKADSVRPLEQRFFFSPSG